MRLLIGLLSCHQHRSREVLCEQTWIPAARALGWQVVFLVGEGRRLGEPLLDPPYLRCPCNDTYLCLPGKTQAFCRWAVERDDWDLLLKADNDSLVIPRRVAALDLGADYLGCEPGGRWRGYASGAGYFLSHHAAEIVASQMKRTTGSEDVLVGRTLQRAGIQLTQDQRIDPWGHRPPAPDNGTAISHHLDESRWRATWETCQG